MQGNRRNVRIQPPDTVFLPIVLLPGTLPVNTSPLLHAEPHPAECDLMGDLLAGRPDTTGEGIRVQGATKPDTFRQQVLATHLSAEHHPCPAVEAAVETFHSQTSAVIAQRGGSVILSGSRVVQKIVRSGTVPGI